MTCLKKYGAPSIEELKNSPGFPKHEDYKLGNIAVIECTEQIPCNPCETSCPKGAIKVGNPITNLPTIELEKCVGCGICENVCFMLNGKAFIKVSPKRVSLLKKL